MHLGSLLSTQEVGVARGVLSNLPRASITPWLHAARKPPWGVDNKICIVLYCIVTNEEDLWAYYWDISFRRDCDCFPY